MTRRLFPLIGAHVSAAGSLARGIENARAIGADCVQIFGSSPRQWQTRALSDLEAAAYRAAAKDFGPTYLHAAYLVNLGSADSELYERSVRSLSEHLAIAQKIGAEGLIFHIGSANGAAKEEVFGRVRDGMRRVLASVRGSTRLIMENSGSVKKLGSHLAELGRLLRAIRSPRVRVCIDTAHAFEAGIIRSYASSDIAAFLAELEEEIGIERVAVLHVNDSMTPWNSQRDQHENIGEGAIGIEGFRNLARVASLCSAAWILEVPGLDGAGPDSENVRRIRSCFA